MAIARSLSICKAANFRLRNVRADLFESDGMRMPEIAPQMQPLRNAMWSDTKDCGCVEMFTNDGQFLLRDRCPAHRAMHDVEDNQ